MRFSHSARRNGRGWSLPSAEAGVKPLLPPVLCPDQKRTFLEVQQRPVFPSCRHPLDCHGWPALLPAGPSARLSPCAMADPIHVVVISPGPWWRRWDGDGQCRRREGQGELDWCRQGKSSKNRNVPNWREGSCDCTGLGNVKKRAQASLRITSSLAGGLTAKKRGPLSAWTKGSREMCYW